MDASRRYLAGAVLQSRAVLAVEYVHAESAKRTPYRHEMETPVQMWLLPNGDVVLTSESGLPLWGRFTVPAGE